MTKGQIALLVGTLGLFSLLYFGCDTKPKNVLDLEKSRSIDMEATGVQNILREARKSIPQEGTAVLETLQQELSNTKEDTSKVKLLERIAGTWYSLGNSTLSGYYAEEIAKIKDNEDSWSIAGTSYAIGAKQAQEQKVRDFSTGRAIKAFEKAIAHNPDNVSHRVNLAISYVDNPMGGSPMKGIMMLRELQEKYPTNTTVLNTLGRLAIRTNQVEKALERLGQAIQLEPNNKTTSCLLAKAYRMKGDLESAEKYKLICEER